MDGDVLRRHEGLSLFLECLQQDLIASELYWSLFLTAAFHYKVDSLLRPFPSAFVSGGGEKDVVALRQVCGGVPSFGEVLASRCSALTDEQAALLSWLFSGGRQWSLASRNPGDKVAELRRLTGEALPARCPSHLFELVYGAGPEERFERLRGGRPLLHAYHGSRAENFYSILKNGLQSHMNKTSLFGEGTYLTSELAVAMEFSPLVPVQACGSLGGDRRHGDRGGSSGCGRLSVVALCELVDDASIKCDRRHCTRGQDDGVGAGGGRRASGRAPNSQAGDVPEKYYVATNNEMVRVKYLLVYASPGGGDSAPQPTAGHATAASVDRASSSYSSSLAASMWRRHRFSLSMLLYAALLLCIGLLSSKRFWSHVRKLCRHASDALALTEWRAAGDW